MDIKKLNEELTTMLEADWDSFASHSIPNGDKEDPNERIIYQQGKSQKGANWTSYDEGTITVNILGVDIDYKVIDTVCEDKEDQQIFGGLHVEASYNFDKQTDELNKVIKREILNQLKEKSGHDFKSIGGTKMIGIPNSIK